MARTTARVGSPDPADIIPTPTRPPPLNRRARQRRPLTFSHAHRLYAAPPPRPRPPPNTPPVSDKAVQEAADLMRTVRLIDSIIDCEPNAVTRWTRQNYFNAWFHAPPPPFPSIE